MESTGEGEAMNNLSPNESQGPPALRIRSNLSLQSGDQHGFPSSSSEEHDRNRSDDEDLLQEIALNEEYGESVDENREEYDSDVEYDDVLSDRGSHESFRENVVFEHTLKHSSFFENARERRRRHLENRQRGSVPMLHFTGTRKTDFWSNYGIEPNKVIPPGNVQGIHAILTEDEFKKLGPAERRLHVNGQKFKIVANSKVTNSLYRAITQSLGLAEEEHKIIREAILHEIVKQWAVFCCDVCTFCGKSVSEEEALTLDPTKMIEKYRKKTTGNTPPPPFELVAAALHFGFSFSVMELTTSEQPISVKNCTNERVLLKSTAKYHFLKTGKSYSYYEFLLPIGPLKKIQDGIYQTVLRSVVLVEKQRPWHSVTEERKPKYHPVVGIVPIGFGLDHRIFFYRSTISHDLWSLLAELIFRKLVHAPQIKRRITDSKHDFALYYLACKAKKRYLVRGNASIEKLADDFSQRFSKENPRGDLEDLAQAAIYFDFSYTVIGLDSCGNFFWRDYVQREHDKRNGPYLAFFVKTTPDKSVFWYALEDVGRACPKERRLYKDVQSGDLRQWGGKFYFHSVPTKVSSFIDKDASSSTNLLKAPTRMFSQATKWATNNLGKLRSTLVATISAASVRTKGAFQSFLGFFNRFRKSRHKVHPSKKVEALYIRDQP